MCGGAGLYRSHKLGQFWLWHDTNVMGPNVFLEDVYPNQYSPPPRNQPLWRYMSLAKFVALAAPRPLYDQPALSGLFVPRADHLGDPFEGSLPRLVQQLELSSAAGRIWPERFFEGLRRWTFVSCWHASDHQSAALWKLYSGSEGGLAIKSTYERLRNCLYPVGASLAVSRVEYIDYERETFRIGLDRHINQPFLHKRKSFEHEKEVRLIINDTPPASGPEGRVRLEDFLSGESVLGRILALHLAGLVEKVYVAPTEPSWVAETVSRMIRGFGWDVPVEHARDGDPIF